MVTPNEIYNGNKLSDWFDEINEEDSRLDIIEELESDLNYEQIKLQNMTLAKNAAIEKAKKFKKEFHKLKKDYKEKESELQKQRKEMEKAEKTFESDISGKDLVIEELKSEIGQWETNCKRMESQLKSREESRKVTRTKHLQKLLEQSKNKLQKFEEENGLLREELQQKSEDLDRIRKDVTRRHQEITVTTTIMIKRTLSKMITQ